MSLPNQPWKFTPVSLKHHISWKGAPGSEIGDPIEKKSHEEVAGSPMELETELQKWERVLVGKQFVLDTEADAPLQFTPEDDSVSISCSCFNYMYWFWERVK